MEQYRVQLEDWQGPLDLLLRLIEEQELDITKVSLSKVAEQFISYMNSRKIKPEETADFLVIAAKLIYIKSKTLLPNLDLGEDEGIDLEKQLKMYKEYIEASKVIQKILAKKKFCFSREKFAEGLTSNVFYAPKSLNAEKLEKIYRQVISRIKPILVLPQRIIEKTIKLSERIEHIRLLILSKASASFSSIIGDSKSKTEKIISFLAILELAKQKIIHVDQTDLFEDISLKKI